MSVLPRRNSAFSSHHYPFHRLHLQLVLSLALLFLLLCSDSTTASSSGGLWVRGFKGPTSSLARAPMATTYRHYVNPWYLNHIKQKEISFPRSLFSNWPLLQGTRLTRLVGREKKSIRTLTKLYPSFWSRATTSSSSTPAPPTAVRKEIRASRLVHDDTLNYMFPLGLGALGRRPKGRRLRWG